MTEKLAVKTLSQILEIEKRENSFHFKDGFLFHKNVRLCRTSDIENISYKKETAESFSLHIDCEDFKSVLVFDKNGVKEHIEPLGIHNLYGDDMAKYLDGYYTYDEATALSDYELISSIEKLIDESHRSIKAQIAYIDAFLSEQEGFSEEKALEYMQKNVQKYLKK